MFAASNSITGFFFSVLCCSFLLFRGDPFLLFMGAVFRWAGVRGALHLILFLRFRYGIVIGVIADSALCGYPMRGMGLVITDALYI